ncbi:unnamed protein product [Cylicocyclus nassatus]|uniref:Cation/H+ exchanger domain-containing protein n=1 Tax=Cylicocyclus nassatus TaxID=53992 RepID=A0AA36H338_CYLNA|nr:unnamed protein product [Cylicocyclus nassatus]
MCELFKSKTLPVSEIEAKLREWAEENNVSEEYSEYLRRFDEERSKFFNLVHNMTAVVGNFYDALEEIVENKSDSFVNMQKKLKLLLNGLTKSQKKIIKRISSVLEGENVLPDFKFFMSGNYNGGLSDNDIYPLGSNRINNGYGYTGNHIKPYGEGHENSIFDKWDDHYPELLILKFEIMARIKDSEPVQQIIDSAKNVHINSLITSFFILFSLYLTTLAAFGRNILHPFNTPPQTIVQTTNTSAPFDDSSELINSSFSLFFLLVTSLCAGKIFRHLFLPPLLGCLLVGIIVNNVGFLREVFYINARWEWCIRALALTVILIRGGIGLDWFYLRRALGITFRIGFITAAVESGTIAAAAVYLFGWPVYMGLLCGFVMAAVSPAVTVPIMLDLQKQALDTRKGTPTLVLASAALDNIFCITAFSITATVISAASWLIWWFPIENVEHRAVCRVFLLLFICSAAVLGGQVLGFQSAGIMATVLICFMAGVRWKNNNNGKSRHEEKAFALMWDLFFMPLLFSLIGMKLDFSRMTWTTVWLSCAIIGIGAASRFLSGMLCSLCAGFHSKERIVITLSLLPKASVQAALAPSIVALVTDKPYLQEAQTAVAACVLVILLTAPLGHFILSRASTMLFKDHQITIE